jgi:hypothetical protein
MIRSTAIILVSVIFGFLHYAKAQEIESPKFELYGGYEYVRYNANPRINGAPPSESFGANGISGQAVYDLNSRFGIVGELSGYSVVRQNRNTTYQISYLFGPRVSLRRHAINPFAWVLFGGVWAEDGITFGSVSAFGMKAGGGIDLRVSKHIAVRPVQVAYFMTKFPDGANDRQNNVSYGAGVVLRLGQK